MLGLIRRVSGLPLRSVIFDVTIAVLLLLDSLLAPLHQGGFDPYDLFGTGMAVALLARRRRPVPVFVAVCLCGVGQLLVGGPVRVHDLAVLIAMYSVVKYAERMVWSWAAAGAVLVGSLAYGLAGSDAPSLAGGGGTAWYLRAGTLVVYATPIWLIGLTMRTRRLYVRSLVDRAVTAERERDQRARLAVADERGRIARELHDVVAHSLAVMIVQADGATYAIDGDPETAKKAVRTVADTGREALADMRRLVAVLRGGETRETAERAGGTGQEPGVAGADDRRRVGLGRLDELLARFRAAGLRIELTTSGTVRPLPGGVDLAGYRIVQEALTNVLKHAGAGTTATVAVGYREDRVEVEICDDGSGTGFRVLDGQADRGAGTPGTTEPLPGGHGLLGMRERVAVYGGRFEAGPRVGPGWRVTATLPVPAGTGRYRYGRHGGAHAGGGGRSMTIRVVLVDDQELVRAGFRMVLGSQPDLEVVGEAGDGAEALALLARTPADVVVMDIRMPVMDGVEATRRLLAGAGPAGDGDGAPRVLVLTTFDTDADAFAALNAGASGFLLKNVPPEDLLAAIRVVASGDSVVAPRVTRRLLDRFAGQLAEAPAPDRRLAELTDREREVLLLLAQGLSNAEIAARLVVAEATVKTHVSRILTKLDLRDRVQAVVFAYETGLVHPGL